MKPDAVSIVCCLFVLAGLLSFPSCGGDEPAAEPDAALAGPPPERGITRSLAEARAAIVEDVSYDLRFALDKGADRAAAHGSMKFSLKSVPDQLVVDFAPAAIQSLEVNGKPVDVHRADNHIVIPGRRLEPGANTVSAAYEVSVGRGGTALTRFPDDSDGTEYVYTLLVPADAHQLFPCFDQPDLKGRMALVLDIPAEWTAVSNSPVESVQPSGSRKTVSFQRTKPLSTYVMAFTAGDYVQIADSSEAAAEFPMALYARKSKQGRVESAELFNLHREALNFCVRSFDTPYPFEKYEFVLVPGFPYGGMEHAGAVFFRETALTFDQEPVHREILNRQLLIFHEVVHQWFGNLVTMKWFDDLWLKEGFATYYAYRVFENIKLSGAWFRFHQFVKTRAYEVDASAGTTPIYQELDNLYDAKSAYGALVYDKAPAVLQQLDFMLGHGLIKKAVKLCLDRYAFGNAGWREVFACFEEAAGRDLQDFIQAWILTADMPVVTAQWDVTEDGKIANLVLTQKALHGSDVVWPMRSEVLLWYPALEIKGQFNAVVVPADFEDGRAVLSRADGSAAPYFVFSNSGDRSYGKFELDDKSLRNIAAAIPSIKSLVLRVFITSALWDMVRDARFAPTAFVDLLLNQLQVEEDAITVEIELGRVVTALDYYLGPAQQAETLPRVEALLLGKIEAEDTPHDLRLSSYRALVKTARSPEALGWLKKVLAGEVAPKGIVLEPRDRWQIVARLLAADFEGAVELYEAERAKGGVDAERYAFVARAATADRAVKEEYFQAYLEESRWPEQWLEESLAAFNTLSQSEPTLPYLRRALESVEWVKDHRKIFFMPRWIAAFIDGQRSREALDVVHAFLKDRQDLPRDIRLKILQSVDGLERAVRIREAYGQ